jgi:hypothetical protein
MLRLEGQALSQPAIGRSFLDHSRAAIAIPDLRRNGQGDDACVVLQELRAGLGVDCIVMLIV